MGLTDGRGRWYRWDKRETTADGLRLSVSAIARRVGLDRGATATSYWTWGSGRRSSATYDVLPGVGLRFRYSYGGEDIPPYIVRIAYTMPHYGGRRPWFVCPACGRRVAYLYAGRLFLCRECQGLTYESKQKRGADAVLTAVRNRRGRLEQRLGWERGDYTRAKPKGMHWRTYLRLRREHDELADLEDVSFYATALHVLGGDVPEYADPRILWAEAKRDDYTAAPEDVAFARWAATMGRSRRRQGRELLPLAELAQRAGVPYDLARDAVRAKLVRADTGRGTRSPRYRVRLASWLGKLHTLRESGMSWADIRAWSARRWDAGNEGERAWPAGRTPRAGVEPHPADGEQAGNY